MAGKVHREQPDMTELGKQRRPDGAALRHAVEQDNRRAAPVREHTDPQAGPREFEEGLADIRADGGKQVPFRPADAPLEIPGRPGLMVHGFSLSRLGVMAANLASHARTVRSSSRLRSASAARSTARTRRVAASRHARPRSVGRTSTTR
jgi:hypothetical protein